MVVPALNDGATPLIPPNSAKKLEVNNTTSPRVKMKSHSPQFGRRGGGGGAGVDA